LLLHANEVVSVDKIVDALWGEDANGRAMGTLRVHIANLRRVLEPGRLKGAGAEILVTQPPGYLLRAHPDGIDSNRFERLAAEGRRALDVNAEQASDRLTEALNLWRGSALEEVTYETFAQAEIQRLEELRLSTVEDRNEARLATGDHAGLVGELESQVAKHPLRERLWGQLMLALYRSGRQADSLAAHRRLSDILGQHGLVPSPGLSLLEDRILLNDPTLMKPALKLGPHRHPPSERTRLIGRDRALTELQSRLASARLLTLTGTGGVGKTRLAQRLAWSIIEDGGEVWWVELSSLYDAQLIPGQIAAAGGIAEDADVETVDLLVRLLSARELVIVLDNCEHVVDAAARLIDRLLTEAPGVRFISTTREPLQVQGEQVWRVPSLSVPDTIAPTAELESYSSVELFVERARARGVDIEQSALPAVAIICRRLDGIPLALELAAARTTTLPLGEISARLADRFSLLERGGRTALARHRTLEAAIEWSFRLLDEPDRHLLSRLAVFVAGFDLEAAREVCAFEPLTAEDVEAGVERLVDKSMIEYATRRPDLRFRLTESIQAFAWDRLVDDPDQLLNRHGAWALRLAGIGGKGLLSNEGLWYPKLEAAHEDLRSAFSWSLRRGDVDAALRLAGSLGGYFCWRHTNVGLEWLETAVKAAKDSPELVRPGSMALGLVASGPYLCYHNRFEEGRQRLEDAAERYLVLDNSMGLMWTRFQQSFFPSANHPEECVRYAESAVELARKLSDPVAMAYSLTRLAETLLLRLTHRGDPMADELDLVLTLCNEARSYCQELPQAYASSVEKTVSGSALALGGRVEEGLTRIEAGLLDRGRFAAGVPCAAELVSAGQLALRVGYEERATALIRQGLHAFQDLGLLYATRSALVGAAVALRKKDPVIAARVVGAAGRLQPSFLYGTCFIADEDHVIEQVRSDLGSADFTVEEYLGSRLTAREAIDLALLHIT
jgi:predicted ATPase/DNA-binding SARP family transcriptional activator